MIIYANGQKIDLPDEKTLSVSEFLRRQRYDVQKVAVEKNGSIVTRKDFDAEMLANGDKIEIVHFVGGG